MASDQPTFVDNRTSESDEEDESEEVQSTQIKLGQSQLGDVHGDN